LEADLFNQSQSNAEFTITCCYQKIIQYNLVHFC